MWGSCHFKPHHCQIRILTAPHFAALSHMLLRFQVISNATCLLKYLLPSDHFSKPVTETRIATPRRMLPGSARPVPGPAQ